MRRYYDWDLNFLQTATGRHVMLEQADESNRDISNTGSQASRVDNGNKVTRSQVNA